LGEIGGRDLGRRRDNQWRRENEREIGIVGF